MTTWPANFGSLIRMTGLPLASSTLLRNSVFVVFTSKGESSSACLVIGNGHFTRGHAVRKAAGILTGAKREGMRGLEIEFLDYKVKGQSPKRPIIHTLFVRILGWQRFYTVTNVRNRS